MRALFIIVLVCIGLGFIFWGDLFQDETDMTASTREQEPVRVKAMEEPKPSSQSILASRLRIISWLGSRSACLK